MNDLSRLRRQLRDSKRAEERTPPRALRLEVAQRAISERNDHGLSYKRFSKALGVSSATLNNWLELARAEQGTTAPTPKKRNAASKVLPVSVAEAPEATRLSVRLSSGLVVEGLSIKDVAALHRALA